MLEPHSELLQHADDVWRIVIRLVSDPDDARDCYQQTFADALKIPGGKVENWRGILCRIATRRAMDVLRRRYRDRETTEFVTAEPVTEIPPDASIQLAELRQSVRIVLANLPPLQAEAFALRHIENMEPSEIAEQLGIDPAHVRVLVHRAMNQLRKSLPESLQPVRSGLTSGEKANGH